MSKGAEVGKFWGLTGDSVCPNQTTGTLRTSNIVYKNPEFILRAMGSVRGCQSLDEIRVCTGISL